MVFYAPHCNNTFKFTFMNWETKNILIVDDDEGSYVLTKSILSETGAAFEWANNGKAALKMVDEEPFNVVIMDIKMPELDGIETTKLMKEKLPDLPIIVQTAFAYDSEKQRALEAGCDGYITKPIDMEGFVDMVKGFIK